MKRRLVRLALTSFVAVLSVLLPNPQAHAVPASSSVVYADTIGGYPLRPITAGNLVTGNPWAAWGGTTLSVTRPGGQIRWVLGTSLWVSINGQAAPYWGDVTAAVWVEQSTALCDFGCHPTTWNLVGPDNQCWYSATAHAQSWTTGDHGCWPARSNLSFYRITAVITWRVPLDADTTGGQPTPHTAILVSDPMIVPY